MRRSADRRNASTRIPRALAGLLFARVLGPWRLRVDRPEGTSVPVDASLRASQGGDFKPRVGLADRVLKVVSEGQGDRDVYGALGHIDWRLYEAKDGGAKS